MRGHEQILKMRRQGKTPKWLYVVDAAIKTHMVDTVTLDPGEVPELQDWRFVVGLTVFVTAWDEERADRIAAEVAKHAKRVITHVMEAHTDKLGWPVQKVLKIKDTEGVMVWPE